MGVTSAPWRGGQLVRGTISLLTADQRKHLAKLCAAVAAAALLEAAGVALVMPFMQLMATGKVGPWGHWLTALGLDAAGPMARLLVGGLTLLLVTGAAVGSLLVRRRVIHFCYTCAQELSGRLFARYLQAPYSYHLSHHSSKLADVVLGDCDLLVSKVFLGSMAVVTNATVATAIVAVMMWAHTGLTIALSLGLLAMYLLIYRQTRKRIHALSAASQAAANAQLRTVHEALAGVREVKTFAAEAHFQDATQRLGQTRWEAAADVVFLSEMPRKVIETSVVGVVFLVMGVLGGVGHAVDALPTLALYLYAGFRLLPSLQQMFQQWVIVRFHAAQVQEIHRTLHDPLLAAPALPGPSARVAPRTEPDGQIGPMGPLGPLGPLGLIDLRGVAFAYPSEPDKWVLRDLNLRIGQGDSLAIVGASGTGKSTLVALLMGLLPPTQGALWVDGRPLDAATWPTWRSRLGYLPQQITLVDDTVAANIALGDAQPDLDKVMQVAKLVCLHDAIVQWRDGYQTRLGQNGARLSGGERQRLGLARALYVDPDLLILDEATSGLDPDTEQRLLDGLQQWRRGKALVQITHREASLQLCDRVYRLADGRLVPVAEDPMQSACSGGDA
ncbi:MAG: hypothetical protein RI907_3522 [Pseudomonadota bacterium]